MKKIYVCSAFSLSMLDRKIQNNPAINSIYFDGYETVRIPRPVSEEAISKYSRMMLDGEIEWESAVGHADTAAVFADQLGLPILQNRISVKLKSGEFALIGQYIGPRLPEGAVALPEGATFEWWIV